MAVLPQALTRRPGRAAALLPLLVLAGCVTLGSHVAEGPPPSAEVPTQLVMTWLPRAVQGVDTMHGGQVAVGLAGRVWLMGPSGCPLVGDGSLSVELYTEPPAPGAAPQMLEVWNIDHDNLHKKCLKRDMVGWGYNLELPWSTYRPEITRVLMRACYQPAKGAPLYAPLQPVTLSDENQTVVYPATTVTGVPAAQAPAAQAPARPAPAQAAAGPPRSGPMSNLPTFRPGATLSAAQGATP
jgi:hypothetical protein